MNVLWWMNMQMQWEIKPDKKLQKIGQIFGYNTIHTNIILIKMIILCYLNKI